MPDKDKEAFWKGVEDYKVHSEHTSFSDILGEAINGGSYNPPSGHEEAYKAGWDEAERESKEK